MNTYKSNYNQKLHIQTVKIILEDNDNKSDTKY